MSEEQPDKFVAISIIEFDDETASAMVLCSGSLEHCQKTADLVPAVAYSGDKRATAASVRVMPEDQWKELSTP